MTGHPCKRLVDEKKVAFLDEDDTILDVVDEGAVLLFGFLQHLLGARLFGRIRIGHEMLAVFHDNRAETDDFCLPVLAAYVKRDRLDLADFCGGIPIGLPPGDDLLPVSLVRIGFFKPDGLIRDIIYRVAK